MTGHLTQAFLNERFDKDNFTYFRVYDTYTPNYYKKYVSRKFYSKYERNNLDRADPELVEHIKKLRYGIPKDRYPWPVTENQLYGWFPELLVELDRADDRFFHPRMCNGFIKHQLKLQSEEADFPKPKFTGVPFKVQ